MRIGSGQPVEVVHEGRRIRFHGAVRVADHESRHAVQRLPGAVPGRKLDHRRLAVALNGVGQIEIGEQFRPVDAGGGPAEDDRAAKARLQGSITSRRILPIRNSGR